jgi:uncharacterized protein (DUF1330 family)
LEISGAKEEVMAKGYWIAFYRSIWNPAVLVEYAKVAAPAIQAGGGTVLARGTPAKAYEAGIKQRIVMIEFESVEKAIQTYESEKYQEAVKLLGRAVEREVRIVEGVA